jgi:hypothetical protein
MGLSTAVCSQYRWNDWIFDESRPQQLQAAGQTIALRNSLRNDVLNEVLCFKLEAEHSCMQRA